MTYKILLTNDDGIYSPGIKALFSSFKADSLFEVFVVAPSEEYSGSSHGITLREAICTKPVKHSDINGIAVKGTPADCVKLALLNLHATIDFDLVISGINSGSNNGSSIHYSGTVGAAKEAALYKIPAIAISLFSHDDQKFNEAADFLNSFLHSKIKQITTRNSFLNINIPLAVDYTKMPIFCKMGTSPFISPYKNYQHFNTDLWYCGDATKDLEKSLQIDEKIILNNQITITPLQVDLTDYHELDFWQNN